MNKQEIDQAKQKFELIKTAYDNGEIKLTRSALYRKKIAKPGHVFYLIKFTQKQGKQKISVYDGAYELSLEAEQKLPGAQLTTFLLIQLTTQL